MANETKVGTLVIELQTRTKALEEGLETAQKKLQSIEKQNEQLKNSNSQLDASFIAMSATAVVALGQIKSAIEEGVEKYNQYVNSQKAVQKVCQKTGNSFFEVKDAMKEVNEFKFMTDTDVATSMKNLLNYGFTVKQATELLKALQDTAIDNKEAQYETNEAVVVTTEGIRMENSVLSNAAGVQINVAKTHEILAKELGKTTEQLTQAEKATAVYNSFMEEASTYTGRAREEAGNYTGQQAQLNATNLELSRTIGESMIPALTEYNSLQLSITKALTNLIKNNKTASNGIITLTTGLIATVAVFGTVKTALLSYTKATGVANATTKAFTASLMANPLFLGRISYYSNNYSIKCIC